MRPASATIADLVFDRLEEEGSNIRQQWQTPTEGTATRHAVIDDLLPPDLAAKIHDAFPKDATGFRTARSFREHKSTTQDPSIMAPLVMEAIYAFQHADVVSLIGEATGIDQLEPDPTHLRGGLSMMFKDNFLNPHIDNSHGPGGRLYRRLNLLYYVAPDWRTENGGNLELWDENVRRPVTLTARFNRLVIMNTNRISWHSVSPVVVDEPRCCVSNYYFSPLSPHGEDYAHVTSFTGRPEQKMRRAIGVLDNAARQFAKSRLGATRKADVRAA